MRSRYSAYVEGNIDYLLDTWHSSTRPEMIDPGTIPQWCGLAIINCEAGGRDDPKGVVEFRATSCTGGKSFQLCEVSRFVREEGQWFYVDGDILEDFSSAPSTKKVGRNELCPCGSGRKYKKCCVLCG